jgi:succinyl-diaminopimelate desuccinylase
MVDVIGLTQKLISFNTINPPGNERIIAEFVGNLLAENGFSVKYPVFAENRLQLVAERGLSEIMPPIVLSGHFDTVPLGEKEWTTDPFSGEIIENKIFGRGSSDMKGGLAAMICAAIDSFEEGFPVGGVRLIFSASEEPGCFGAKHLVETGFDLGKSSAIIVGEPTSNVPSIGHKGALYLNVSATGKTVHSSMPELGVNAIYKAARAICKIEKLNFNVENDPLLGLPTANVGKMQGGMNINSVPDHAEFTIDIRSTSKISHSEIIERLWQELGKEVTIKKLVDLPPVSSSESSPFVQMVYEVCEVDMEKGVKQKSLPFMTDGSVLQQFYGGVPTVILGPGQPEIAHQSDEFCYAGRIEEAVIIYKNIILKNGRKHNGKIS